MAHEQVAADLQLRLVEMDVVTEAPEQGIPPEPADGEADVVTDDRAERRGDDDPSDREMPAFPESAAAVMSIVSPGNGTPRLSMPTNSATAR